MASMTVEINTSRAVSPQILRHRSFSFQEFCLAGDARITVNTPGGAVQRIPIATLYKLWKSSKFKARNARAYDSSVERFVEAPIRSVYFSGKKPVYGFTIQSASSSRSINCTREHRVLTRERGFVPFGEAYDDGLTVALNGVSAEPLPYQQRETLERSAWMGSELFAKEHGIASVTARKWFRHHQVTPANPSHWPSSRIDLEFDGRLASFMKWARREIRAGQCQKCGHDGSRSRLELSHVRAHDGDSRLAFDVSNLQTLCASCHRRHDISSQQKRYGWTLGMKTKWGRIVEQQFLGIQDTYDIEMDHPTHNFVADGVIVHNSQRYSASTSLSGSIPLPHLRRQDTKNKQASHDDLDGKAVREMMSHIDSVYEHAVDVYEGLLAAGVAKECAREVLPLGTPTRLYMAGTLRSWITYIALREKNGTQLEHQKIALSCKKVLSEECPIIAEALGGPDSPWDI